MVIICCLLRYFCRFRYRKDFTANGERLTAISYASPRCVVVIGMIAVQIVYCTTAVIRDAVFGRHVKAFLILVRYMHTKVYTDACRRSATTI